MLTFDVILPSIGRDSLCQAIDSVFAQTHKDWRLYIYEQGSTTDLSRFVKYGKTPFCYWYDCILRNDKGAWARNCMVEQGKNSWLTYIDDDDEWLPNHLSTIAALIEANPGTNMIRTAGQSFMMKHRSPRSSKLVRKMGPVNSTDILTVGMAHTRDLFKQTTGWKPIDNHDHLLWREMLAAGGQPITCDAITFNFRR